MVWDYLSLFWNKIVEVGSYPIEYFQGIGNAVAGSLGQFFDVIFHNINDIFAFAGWFGSSLKDIFLSLLSPVNYIFIVLKTSIGSIFSPPGVVEVSYAFSPEILDVFNTIPHWPVFVSVLGSVIILLVGIKALKLILRS